MSDRPQTIYTSRAPKPAGPYSQAVRAGDTLYLAGQVGVPAGETRLAEGLTAQTEVVFDNLAAVCEAGGGSLEDLVKLNIYMTDLGHFAEVNRIMQERMPECRPARATVQVAALPLGAQIEMDGVAILRG